MQCILCFTNPAPKNTRDISRTVPLLWHHLTSILKSTNYKLVIKSLKLLGLVDPCKNKGQNIDSILELLNLRSRSELTHRYNILSDLTIRETSQLWVNLVSSRKHMCDSESLWSSIEQDGKNYTMYLSFKYKNYHKNLMGFSQAESNFWHRLTQQKWVWASNMFF